MDCKIFFYWLKYKSSISCPTLGVNYISNILQLFLIHNKSRVISRLKNLKNNEKVKAEHCA